MLKAFVFAEMPNSTAKFICSIQMLIKDIYFSHTSKHLPENLRAVQFYFDAWNLSTFQYYLPTGLSIGIFYSTTKLSLILSCEFERLEIFFRFYSHFILELNSPAKNLNRNPDVNPDMKKGDWIL